MLVLMLSFLLLCASAFGAQQTINPTDTLSVGTPKINANFTNLFLRSYSINQTNTGTNTAGWFVGNGSNITVTATGGNTSRKISDWMTNTLDVSFFGADPTGSQDSTIPIQNAINSLPVGNGYSTPSGGIIHFPVGHYSITNTLHLLNGVVLQGERGSIIHRVGTNTDTIAFDSDSFTPGYTLTAGVKGLTIETIEINSAGSAIHFYGTANAMNPTIEDVYVEGDFYDGITLKNCVQGTVENCRVQGVLDDGFVIGNSANGVNIAGNYAIGNGGYGYRLKSNYCPLIGCAADGNRGGGYYIESSAMTMVSCGAEQNWGNTYTLTNCNGTSLNNCYMWGGNANSVNGVWIDGGCDIGINDLQNDGNAGGVNGWAIVLTNISGSYPLAVSVSCGDLVTWGLGTINNPTNLLSFSNYQGVKMYRPLRVQSQGVGYGAMVLSSDTSGAYITSIAGNAAAVLGLIPPTGFVMVGDGITVNNRIVLYNGAIPKVLLHSGGDSYFRGGDVALTYSLTANAVISTNGYSISTTNGINATINVLVGGGTTNRLVFYGGILVSNITSVSP